MVTNLQKRGAEDEPKRRTQAERRSSTQKIVLEATLRTMAEHGYAGTSLSQITEEAKVSRGAINHHFPSKAELVASAMRYFYASVLSRDSTDDETVRNGTLRERLLFKYQLSLKTMPLRLEFLSAMRTDSALREAYLQKVRAQGDSKPFYDEIIPEISGDDKADQLVHLLSGVFLGLGLMNTLESDGQSLATFEYFIDLLENHLNNKQTDRS